MIKGVDKSTDPGKPRRNIMRACIVNSHKPTRVGNQEKGDEYAFPLPLNYRTLANQLKDGE